MLYADQVPIAERREDKAHQPGTRPGIEYRPVFGSHVAAEEPSRDRGVMYPQLHPLRDVLNAIFYSFWLRIPTNGLGRTFLRGLYTHLLPHL